MPDLEISPKSVTLGLGEMQQFQAFKGGQPDPTVVWSIQPAGDGQISASGAYTSPRRIPFRRRVIVLATPGAGGTPATAVIELEAVSFWTHFLGGYLILAFLALLSLVIFRWEWFCPTCKPAKVLVSPPVITLATSQAQLFTANVPVQWSADAKAGSTVLGGLYVAPATLPPGGRVQIRATAKDPSQEAGTAEVVVPAESGLALQPAKATITAGGSLDLTAFVSRPPAAGSGGTTAPEVVEWLTPEVGTLTPSAAGGSTARFSIAASAIAHSTTVLVLARVQGTERIAGAWVTVVPASLPVGTCAEGCGCGSDVAALLRLIAIMGALGGLIHGISSFTTYVGNRQFLTSWVWWYVFKPFLAGLVALVVFLVFRAGFGMGDFSLGVADCLKVSAFAGLIGLFAEPATLKLKDIFDTLFTPRNDPRRDAATDAKPATLKLESLTPATLTVEQTPLPALTLNGTGFARDCQVKIGEGSLRLPSSATPTQVVVPLLADDVKTAGTLTVVVYNKPPDGSPSNSLPLKVDKKPDPEPTK
jgi:hypothetical protein